MNAMKMMVGYCKDRFCDDPDGATEVFLHRGTWVCGICLEDRTDEEDFNNANELDMMEGVWIR